LALPLLGGLGFFENFRAGGGGLLGPQAISPEYARNLKFGMVV